MKQNYFRFLLLFALFLGGYNLSFGQELSSFDDLLVRAPGFQASKQMESIKSHADGSNGLQFVAYYAQSDLLHFKINRTTNPDNQLLFGLFPDLTFTLIHDQAEARKILDEVSKPKSDVSTPIIKSE